MSIVVQGDCGKKYKVSDDKAGKRFKCKECGEPIVVRRVKKKSPSPDDERRIAKDPVHDMHATLLHLFGLDHKRRTYRFQDRDF